VTPTLRRFTAADLPRVVELSLAAWAPVFVSIEAQLAGSGVFEIQHPDWRAGQRRAVETVCTDPDHAVWVAEIDGDVAGFAAAAAHRDDAMGEIVMIAVDPARQRLGLGAALTGTAMAWFREQGMTTAMVETGGDPGHAPARQAYESAGFTPLPVVRYFRTVDP
jgi:GNAT superfamily N-acetyltransferase